MELDDRLTDRASYAGQLSMMKEHLATAPVLESYETLPPGAELRIIAQRSRKDTSPVSFTFVRSPAPQVSEESQWFTVSPQGHNRPVVLRGACIPGGAVYERGVIKQGLAFCYHEVAFFRSHEDAPRGLLASELPKPERIDPAYLDMVREAGMVVAGSDGFYYWRIPTANHVTGLVLGAEWNSPGLK